jgi:hypothetical protein
MDPIFAALVLAFFLSVIALVALDRGHLNVVDKIIEILGNLLGKVYPKTEEKSGKK